MTSAPSTPAEKVDLLLDKVNDLVKAQAAKNKLKNYVQKVEQKKASSQKAISEINSSPLNRDALEPLVEKVNGKINKSLEASFDGSVGAAELGEELKKLQHQISENNVWQTQAKKFEGQQIQPLLKLTKKEQSLNKILEKHGGKIEEINKQVTRLVAAAIISIPFVVLIAVASYIRQIGS